ncbi:MAG: hypothetical protein EU544_03080, partial [Promethearchaeota archaeon]
MENQSKTESQPEEFSTGTAIAYSFANFTDITTSQFFSFLLFTFYFAVMGVHIFWINITLIVWSIWNSLNDPLMGAISDRTSTKYGKR